MQGIMYKAGTERTRFLIKLILALIAVCVLIFFLIRFVPLSQKDDEMEFLRLVGSLDPLPESYVPQLSQVEGVQVSRDCAESLQAMLDDARQAGCEPLLLEGYLDRKSQQENFDKLVSDLMAQGYGETEALALALKTTSRPGEDEHQLGLTVDIVDGSSPNRDMLLTESATYRWLSDHSWEYGFVIRYPENKTEVTGRDFMPWHYRYVGLESAQLIYDLQLSLEEFYTWFYSEDVIVITE